MAAALAAAVVIVPRAASADQQSSVQAQIGALQQQLAATGQQVHQLTSGYASAEAQVQSIAQQVGVERIQAQRAAAAVAQSGAALRQDLVGAYIGGFSQPTGAGDAVSGTAAVGGDVANPTVRYGYLSIATSSMRDSIDGYRTAELNLNSTLSTLAAEERSAQAAADSADRARQAALNEAAAADTHLTDLEAQLTALEQKAAAQRAAANQAANQAAAARAAQAATQGGPVNGGLVSLVRTQVSPPAAPAASAVPTSAASPASTAVPATTAIPAVAVPSTAPPVTAPPTTAAPAPAPATPSASGNVWLELRQCESGNDYQANTGNGFFGAYQFSQQTWTNLGYPGRPDQEPPAMQDQAAQRLQAESGWGQWPACSAALGLT